jgi:hypothetical protein
MKEAHLGARSVRRDFFQKMKPTDISHSTHTVEKTKVLYGPEKVIDIALQFASNAEDKIDANCLQNP